MDRTTDLAQLRKRVKDDPRSLAFVPLADALRRAGHRAEAMSVIRNGLRHHPDHATARVVLARLHLEAGNRGLAVAMLEEVVLSAPENAAAGSLLAELLVEDGRIREAAALIDRLRIVSPHDPVIQALSLRARPPTKALHGAPGDPFDRVAWADGLAARGDLPRATRAWQRIYNANAQDSRVRDRLIELSRALEGLGEVAGAGSSRHRLPGVGDAVRACLEDHDGPAPPGAGALAVWARQYWSA